LGTESKDPYFGKRPERRIVVAVLKQA